MFDTNTLTFIAQLAAINVMITPLIVAAVTKSHWSGAAKTAVALLSVAVSATFALIQEGHSFTDVSVAIPIAALAVQQAYEHYWKQTGLVAWLSQWTDSLGGPAK